MTNRCECQRRAHFARERWTLKFARTVVPDFAQHLERVAEIVGAADDYSAVARCQARRAAQMLADMAARVRIPSGLRSSRRLAPPDASSSPNRVERRTNPDHGPELNKPGDLTTFQASTPTSFREPYGSSSPQA
jgi:hypothetical protein